MKKTHELTRRQMLAAMAVSTVGGVAQGSVINELKSARHLFSDAKSRIIRIDAKPEPIAIDTAKTAVIVVDMQNDFGSKGGMFDRAGIDISGIQKVIGPTAKVLAAARRAGVKIIYLKMGFRPDLSDLGSPDSPNRVRHLGVFKVGETIRAPDGRESRILIRDTWNTDIVPELKPQAADVVLYKHRFSGFYQTDLDARLKQLGIKYIVVTGCTTSVCVESTIRDAMFRDYLCVLLSDCTSETAFRKSPSRLALLGTRLTVFGLVDGALMTQALAGAFLKKKRSTAKPRSNGRLTPDGACGVSDELSRPNNLLILGSPPGIELRIASSRSRGHEGNLCGRGMGVRYEDAHG